jgi:hypothetical protein
MNGLTSVGGNYLGSVRMPATVSDSSRNAVIRSLDVDNQSQNRNTCAAGLLNRRPLAFNIISAPSTVFYPLPYFFNLEKKLDNRKEMC